jgi:hypothetical protein
VKVENRKRRQIPSPSLTTPGLWGGGTPKSIPKLAQQHKTLQSQRKNQFAAQKGSAGNQKLQTPAEDDNYDIIMQPETRPVSQEQLVAEVKGIYAGLVMVEAKCIEVDNKQATLAQADPSAQPKLNNEQ